MKIYYFSSISYKNLRKITGIVKKPEEKIFEEWFKYPYKIEHEEIEFLKKLIKDEKMYLQFYNEELLKARFIIPLLNKVDFRTDNFRDWYEYEIKSIVNGYILSGKPDFMVASGKIEPEQPYFFIQEFKRSITTSKHPLFQLIAEMSVATVINKTNKMCGAYNIGKWWTFVILKKLSEDKYQYYESESFDCLKIEDLKNIYKNLQAVKHKYCQEFSY